MDVILGFNGKNYTLQLHELNIWTHSATISQEEMVVFIKDIFANNIEIKDKVIGGGSTNVKK